MSLTLALLLGLILLVMGLLAVGRWTAPAAADSDAAALSADSVGREPARLPRGAAQGVGMGEAQRLVVAPGDTLWELARRLAPADDPRDVVAALIEANGLAGRPLQAGQELLAPIP